MAFKAMQGLLEGKKFCLGLKTSMQKFPHMLKALKVYRKVKYLC